MWLDLLQNIALFPLAEAGTTCTLDYLMEIKYSSAFSWISALTYSFNLHVTEDKGNSVTSQKLGTKDENTRSQINTETVNRI